MAVKILIKRKVPQMLQDALGQLLREMRTRTVHQSGYISGETYHRVDAPEEILVISTWQSVDAWKDWLGSEARDQVQQKIDALLGSATSYAIYEHS